MRIILIYPPPWKIPDSGEPPDRSGQGPPPHVAPDQILSGDILTIPYGLLSLAAQAAQAGHGVTVLNLFTFPWQEIENIIMHYSAEVYGLSCFTSNRRGTMALARLIKKLHPRGHIVVGGPHATALPEEMLTYCEAIDTVIIGEGEDTFSEVLQRLEAGKRITGIAGAAWCANGGVTIGPPRKRIDHLDRLVAPCIYYNEYIIITSRGCPWNCSFCSSRAIWGGTHRAHAPDYVLNCLEHIVTAHGQKAIAIKDETFTLNRAHVLDICRGIVKRNLNFLWSCDTRADTLDEELLFMMRRAGCRRISFGVESGSLRVLKELNKSISLDAVRTATALAKKFGFQVRFYMIVGSPEETLETLQESLDFIQSVRPCEVIFNPFTLFPGTQEFERAEGKGLVHREMFFSEDFFELIPLQRENDNPAAETILKWLEKNTGLQKFWNYGVQEQQEILKLFPDLHSAHLDAGHAYLCEANPGEAKKYIQQACNLGFPLPGLVSTYFACIAALQNDIRAALDHLIEARRHGCHAVVEKNLESAQAWIKAGGPASGRALELTADNSFEVTRPMMQPATPGKIVLS